MWQTQGFGIQLSQLPERIKQSEWKQRKSNNKNTSCGSSRTEGPITTGASVRKIKVGDGSRWCWNSKAVGLHNHETWKLKYYWCSRCLFQDFTFRLTCLNESPFSHALTTTEKGKNRKMCVVMSVCACVCVFVCVYLKIVINQDCDTSWYCEKYNIIDFVCFWLWVFIFCETEQIAAITVTSKHFLGKGFLNSPTKTLIISEFSPNNHH